MDKVKLFLLICAACSNIATIIICYYRRKRGEASLFQNSRQAVSDKFDHEIIPDHVFFFVIWPLTFFWNLLGIYYLLASICLRKEISPVKSEPPLITKMFLVFYIVAFGLPVPWEFAYDRENMDLCLCLLMLTALTLYITTALSLKSIHDSMGALKENSGNMLRIYVVLIQNGLALYSAVLSVSCGINMAAVVRYKTAATGEDVILRGLLSDEGSCTAALVTLFVALLVWICIENLWFPHHCRYLITIYPVLVFACATILAPLMREGNFGKSFAMTTAILVTSGIMTLVRCVIVVTGKVSPCAKFQSVKL